MRGKQKYKFIGMIAAMAVVVMIVVSPTIAYLTSSTDPVVNYFSGGSIALTIDEAPVNENGTATDGERVEGNNYKYVAGAVLDKDPTVTVLSGSEECYVYVCVENELPDSLFSLDINTNSWTKVAESGNMTIYRYTKSVDASESNQTLVPIFTTVTISSELTSEDIQELGTRKLTVTAFAVQTASLDTDTADELAADYFFEGADISSIEEDSSEAGETESDNLKANETEDNTDGSDTEIKESENTDSSADTGQNSVNSANTATEKNSTGDDAEVIDSEANTGTTETDANVILE